MAPRSNQKIVRAAIHPAIGIARVGNSRKGTYPGPEVYPTPPLAAGAYRDAKGALKRQTARFRVYGYNAEGEVVRELTAPSDELAWTVHVANRKAAWYQWARRWPEREFWRRQAATRICEKTFAGNGLANR